MLQVIESDREEIKSAAYENFIIFNLGFCCVFAYLKCDFPLTFNIHNK